MAGASQPAAVSHHPADPGCPGPVSFVRGYYAVAVLMLAYALSMIDRIILTLLVQPIQESLQISDTEFSLLTGFAFGFCYSVAAIPIAHLADRHSRRLIIAAGIVGWSVMTAFCGQASNFAQLFIARIGVGIGEASLSPAAVSLLGQLFPRRHLGKALAAFSIGGVLGSALAYLLGGMVIAELSRLGSAPFPFIAHLMPWQITFLIVALPGLPVAALVLLIREPARFSLQPGRSHGDIGVIAHFRENAAAFSSYIAGFSCFNIVFYGFISWLPAFLVRAHGMGTPAAGFVIGIALALGGPAGMFVGGWLADRMAARGRSEAPMIVGAAGSLGMGLAAVVLMALASSGAMIFSVTAFYFFGSIISGIGNLGIQVLTPDHLRARAAAIFFLIISVVGISLGPLLVAILTDYVFGDLLAIGKSLLVVGAVFSMSAVLLFRGGSRVFAQAAERQAHKDRLIISS